MAATEGNVSEMVNTPVDWSNLMLRNPATFKVAVPGVVLGAGANGQVCLGEYENMPVAVKTLHMLKFPTPGGLGPTGWTNTEIVEEGKSPVVISREDRHHLLQEFTREFTILSRVGQSPHVVQVFGIYQNVETSLPCIVMELLEPFIGTIYLQDGTDRFTPLHRFVWNHVAYEVMLGLEFLESNGVIHRDLKPSNLLVTRTRHVKIGDFGESRLIDAAKSASIGRGTNIYLPPEGRRAGLKPSTAYDHFQYGVMLVELALGEQPHPGAEQDAQGMAIPEVIRREHQLVRFERRFPYASSLVRGLLADRPTERVKLSLVRELFETRAEAEWDMQTLDELQGPFIHPEILKAAMEAHQSSETIQAAALGVILKILQGDHVSSEFRAKAVFAFASDNNVLEATIAAMRAHMISERIINRGMAILSATIYDVPIGITEGSSVVSRLHVIPALLLLLSLPEAYDKSVLPLSCKLFMQTVSWGNGIPCDLDVCELFLKVILRVIPKGCLTVDTLTDCARVVYLIVKPCQAVQDLSTVGPDRDELDIRIVKLFLVPEFLHLKAHSLEYYLLTGEVCLLVMTNGFDMRRRMCDTDIVALMSKILCVHGNNLMLAQLYVTVLAALAEYLPVRSEHTDDVTSSVFYCLEVAVEFLENSPVGRNRGVALTVLHKGINYFRNTMELVTRLDDSGNANLMNIVLFTMKQRPACGSMVECAELLHHIAKRGAHGIVSAGGIPIIVNGMAAYQEDDQLQVTCCNVLRQVDELLPAEVPIGVDCISGLTKVIHAAIRKHIQRQPHQLVVYTVCSTLSKIAERTCNQISLREARTVEALKALLEAECLNDLIVNGLAPQLFFTLLNLEANLSDHLRLIMSILYHQSMLYETGLRLLWRASLSQDFKHEPLREKVWTRVGRILEETKEERVTLAALIALLSMSSDPDTCEEFLKLQAWTPHINNALQCYPLNDEIQLYGVQLLGFVAIPATIMTTHGIVGVREALSVVRAAARAFPDHVGIQTQASIFEKRWKKKYDKSLGEL